MLLLKRKSRRKLGPASGRRLTSDDLASVDRAAFFANTREVPNGCVEWQAKPTRSGHYSIKIGRARSTSIQRVAYVFAHGTLPRGKLVRHTCDNSRCVKGEHLIVGSHANNMRDKFDRGRAQLHERERKAREAKVSPALRNFIREYGETNLAAALGVSQIAVIQWRTGRTRPDPARGMRLISLSDNAVHFYDIYEQTPLPSTAPVSDPSPQETTTDDRRRGAARQR